MLALAWAALPLLAFGFVGPKIIAACERLPLGMRLLLPAIFGVPYVIVAARSSHASWVALYFVSPVLIAFLLWYARQSDPQQRGHWCDFAILLLLGLAVDLRWFEAAWPAHLRVINKLILLDFGLYGFIVIRQLSKVGFDLRIRRDDIKTGLRE